MKTEYFLYVLLIVVLAGFAYSISGFFVGSSESTGMVVDTEPIAAPKAEVKETPRLATKSTGTTGQGDVSIELTPHEAADGKLEVDFSINTHSVSLDSFDLTQITTLTYDGKEINPSSADSLSGHHNSGTLTFEVERNPESFVITITGIPKMEERIFQWE